MTLPAISLSPFVPLPVLIAGALCVVALGGLCLWRLGWRSALLRLLAGLALVAVLADAQVAEVQQDRGAQRLLVIADDSASQRVGGRGDTTAALADAFAAPGRWPADIRVEALRLGDADPATLAGEVARAVAADPQAPLTAAVVLTDGLMPDMDRVLGAVPADVPVSAVVTGPEVTDATLEILDAPAFALVDDVAQVTLSADVTGPGARAGRPLTVAVDGPGGRVATHRVSPGARVQVSLPVDQTGVNDFVVSVTGPAEEISTANNARLLQIRGVRDRLRVLLMSGEPHAGERSWRNVLSADPNVDLVHFTILRSVEKDDGTPLEELSLIAFPIRELFEEALPSFDLVIFDRYSQQGLLPRTYMYIVSQYVRRGGATLFAVGPEYAGEDSLYASPLATVLPGVPTGRVATGSVVPGLTPTGVRHPVTAPLVDLQPWGPWLRRVAVETPTAGSALLADRIDMAGGPLLVLDRVGQGRTALLLSDTMWLWGKGIAGGGPQRELLRRTVHWLMQEPELEEERLEARLRDGVLEIARHTMSDGAARVTVTGFDPQRPEGRDAMRVELTPDADGVLRARVPVAGPGVYTVRTADATLTARAEDGTLAREIRRLSPSRTALESFVSPRGGCVLDVATAQSAPLVAGGSVGRGCTAFPAADRALSRIRAIGQRPAVPPWMQLALVCALLLLVWRQESR